MSRLLISRLGDGNIILGNITMAITIGSPITTGVMKEENRFSFIFLLKVWWVLMWSLILAQGYLENNAWILLIGI